LRLALHGGGELGASIVGQRSGFRAIWALPYMAPGVWGR
jgi:hypothetical protein